MVSISALVSHCAVAHSGNVIPLVVNLVRPSDDPSVPIWMFVVRCRSLSVPPHQQHEGFEDSFRPIGSEMSTVRAQEGSSRY